MKVKSATASTSVAGTLKMAEFEINDAGNLVLRQFGTRALGLEGSQETARERVDLSVLDGTDLLYVFRLESKRQPLCRCP